MDYNICSTPSSVYQSLRFNKDTKNVFKLFRGGAFLSQFVYRGSLALVQRTVWSSLICSANSQPPQRSLTEFHPLRRQQHRLDTLIWDRSSRCCKRSALARPSRLTNTSSTTTTWLLSEERCCTGRYDDAYERICSGSHHHYFTSALTT